ncbi:AAA family ATPase [Geofilum rubicundum]|uniref:Abortive infection protein, putative n=1 Tax=Geofilum rubicundum JCM 15548 TaxID=1236989 RepID=A0A0E9M2U7_9BACT|nr:ATP-binding protein [Geofilum rubicundum]GAO31726.1 abortive infection protein, putative [Geofilum rubicundum JCM 15548]
MVIQEFSFGNFRSFKDIQTLNMSSAKIKSKNELIDETNIIHDEKYKGVSFLKSKAIYGANACGKSNIVKAFVAFIRIIKQSVKDEEILSLVEPFSLSTETENAPSFFQLIFWIEKTRYRYGFELDDKQIYAEWLYAKPGERELPYFIRDNQEIIEIDKTNFSEGNKFVSLFDNNASENEIFRSNSLFLSTISSLGFGRLSKELVDNISSAMVINGLGHKGLHTYAGDCLKDEKRKKYIIDFLKYGDTGIDDIDTIDVSSDTFSIESENEENKVSDKNSKRRLVISTRKKYDENLKFHKDEPFPFTLMESEGTLKLFELSPFVFEALKENRPLIIDEFDARFHPLLTKKIIELFNSKGNKNSQLIFITHDTNLLSADFLRRDQIEFVEKDKFGASHLYSLVQFKGIRNTASFEKDYINGKYGAIPFLGDFKKLLNI